LMISELDPEINAYVSNDAKEILSWSKINI
jgi:hypothetical protein